MRLLERYFLIIFCVCLVHIAAAIGPRYNGYKFHHLSTADGLSHKTVKCFLQDRRGYIWIGTTNGLNRYDGYRFKTYFSNSDDSLSVAGNIIFDMVEDRAGLIWLSTNNGFCYFNPRFESFHKVVVPGKGANYQTRSLCLDDDGAVWGVDENNVLIKMQPGEHTRVTLVNIDSLLGAAGLTRNMKIRCFDGYLWVCSSSGIVRFDYKRVKAAVVLPPGVTSSFLRSIKRGDKNELLIVDAQVGVFMLNTQTLVFEVIPLGAFKAGGFNFWNITDVEYMRDGRVWTTTTPGLFTTSASGVTTRLTLETGSSRNFDSDELTCVFRDKDDNLWVGSMDMGVYVLSNKKEYFYHSLHKTSDGKSLPASRIFVSRNNEILFGNPQGLFYCRDRKDLEAGKVKKLLDKPIIAISGLSKREVVVFSAKMIYILNLDKMSLRGSWEVVDIQTGFVDSRGVIWVGYWGKGIQGYDYASGRKYEINIDTVDRNRNIIFAMCGAGDGSLWVGTYGTGIVHVEHPLSPRPKLTVYSHKQGENSISLDEVLSVHEDGNGSVWVGTCGGGLNRLDEKTGLFEVFSTINELKNNVVESVNSDLDGNIWFASSVLSRYDVGRKTFMNFSISDGISSEYFTSASFRGADGTMYFGDDKGLYMFNPREIPVEKKSRVPEFTGARLFGMPVKAGEQVEGIVPFPVSVNHAEKISLPYFLNSLMLEFASVQVFDNKNVSYSYMLEGLDNKWIPVTSGENFATYTGLQSGTYRFKVRSSNGAGTWSNPRELTIEITPPWWQAPWFQVAAILTIALSVTLLVRARLREFKSKSLELEELVRERTVDLECANTILTGQSEMLNSQTHALQQHNKTLVEKQMVIEIKNAELEEALNVKDKLLGTIAHDFKNPLSGMYGLLTSLKERSVNISPRELESHMNRLLSKVALLNDQLTIIHDWVHGHMRDVDANPVEINIETIIDDAIMLVREVSVQKHVTIETQLDYCTNAYVDPRMMSTVMRNLLNNAVRYTPRDGKVTVLVQEYDSGIEVSVIDTGIGMSEQVVSRVFTRDAAPGIAGTDDENATGVGLCICKSLVEKNNGTIGVTSKEGEGSVFTVSLPKGVGEATRKNVLAVDYDELEAIVAVEGDVAVDKSQTILVIDDDPTILAMMKLMLEPFYTVFTATDGQSGLHLARNMVPSLIISDINMPYMNGMDLCRVVRDDAMTSHVPIVLVTSSKNSDILRQSFRSGADDYIEKPFDTTLLLFKVNVLLENSKRFAARVKADKSQSSTLLLPDSFDDKIIRRTVEFINSNLSDSELDVNKVAEEVGLSRSQLWRKFKSVTGKNMSDYLVDLRMEKARQMLKSGKYKVSEIAYDVGFSSPVYFSKRFSEIQGMSPTEFQEASRGNAEP